MINYQTILSNYNERGTLLKWLRTLQTALEGGSLETVTTTTTDDSVVFHFGFADGTSLDSPPIQLEAGPQGPEGPEGPEGPQGPAATIAVGTVTTLPAGSSATVTNTGTSGAAVFDFGLPEGDTGSQGETGPQGPSGTIAIGTVTTLSPGSNATVTNSGTSTAAVFDFGIPQGATGNPGPIIEQIVPVETTTTASRPYAKDDHFVNNLGLLTRATANIALGATINSSNSTPANKTLTDLFENPLTVTNENIIATGFITGDDKIYCFVPYNHADKLNTITASFIAARGPSGIIFNQNNLPSSYSVVNIDKAGFRLLITPSNDVSASRYKNINVEFGLTTT